jgi:hypothetical protein
VYPNPCEKTLNLNYELKKDAHIEIGLFDTKDVWQFTIINKQQAKGIYNISYDFPPQITNGVYILKIISDNTILEKTIIIRNNE